MKSETTWKKNFEKFPATTLGKNSEMNGKDESWLTSKNRTMTLIFSSWWFIGQESSFRSKFAVIS